jgi:hypothetical protein
MPRRKSTLHPSYSIDAGFTGDQKFLVNSLGRLRERLLRVASITTEADEESNSAYDDFLSGLGVGLQSYDIDGSVAAFYENDAMETSYYSDFLFGLDGNTVDSTTIPQQNLAYYDDFEDSVEGDQTQYSTAPAALEVYEDFEDGIS